MTGYIVNTERDMTGYIVGIEPDMTGYIVDIELTGQGTLQDDGKHHSFTIYSSAVRRLKAVKYTELFLKPRLINIKIFSQQEK